jgi:hypothetical protein
MSLIVELNIAVAVALILVGVVEYFRFIKNKMKETAAVTGKADIIAASSGIGKVQAAFIGWKTNILAWVAAFVNCLAALPHVLAYLDEDMLKAWQQIPWVSVFDAKLASYINIGIAILIPITHSIGINAAAKVEPRQ